MFITSCGIGSMNIKKIYAVYFSPAGSTAKVVQTISETVAKKIGVEHTNLDFTLPNQRKERKWSFNSNELVVFGTPTYAGRVPNLILPFIGNLFKAQAAPLISVVTFGNRNFDSSLTELTLELNSLGFRPFAAAGISARHVFSDKLAKDRPDEEDFKLIEDFALKILEMTKKDIDKIKFPLKIRDGSKVAPYYTPLKMDSSPAKFLKAKPVTNNNLCIKCGKCTKVCPFGSIDSLDVTKVSGVCAKCQACVLNCPKKAKYFDNADFLSHIEYLESHFMERKEPEFYFCESLD